jgi:hypothetical protein
MYKRRHKILPWLLFASVALRSIVAPGYEFANVDENGDFRFGIIWCPGLNNIYALDIDDDGHDHDHDQPTNKSSGDHFTATCGLWTGNTNFVYNQIDINAGLLILQLIRLKNSDFITTPFSCIRRNHPPRAPPVFHIS